MQTKPWFHLSLILSISSLAQVKDVPILMHSSRLYHSSMFSLSISLFCTLQDFGVFGSLMTILILFISEEHHPGHAVDKDCEMDAAQGSI